MSLAHVSKAGLRFGAIDCVSLSNYLCFGTIFQISDKCWKISTEEKNWLDAALTCASDNSVLASITSKEKQDRVSP